MQEMVAAEVETAYLDRFPSRGAQKSIPERVP
jgi:hypothetical protein